MTVAILAGHISTNTGKRHGAQVADDVGAVETDSTIQFRKEGCFRITYTEHLAPSPHITQVAELIGPDDIWISPLLGDLTVDDLPDGYLFGNGSTGPVTITKVRDAVLIPVPITVCCFPRGTVLSDAQKYRLQEIFEGIPPGTPS
jgi:hypothetical protein